MRIRVGGEAINETPPRGLDPQVRRRHLEIEAETAHLSAMQHEARVDHFEREFVFRSDEPPSLGGRNEHPTPLEYFTAAIGLCLLTQIERYGRMLKANITAARCRVRITLEAEGSVLESTIASWCRGVRTEVEIESDDDPAVVAAVIRNADQGCYVRSTIRDPVPIETVVRLNDSPFDVDAYSANAQVRR